MFMHISGLNTQALSALYLLAFTAAFLQFRRAKGYSLRELCLIMIIGFGFFAL